ncbi:VENN motif pre-toxin domain-containing protein, partial [Biostraticola tofi]
ALGTLAAGLAGGLAGGDVASAVAGAQAGKNAIENNSLSGDQARESIKQGAASLKEQVREKLGEGGLSATVNGVINAAADLGDTAVGTVDYGADAAMALTACAMGDSYCNKALSDLAGKNQAVADTVTALMKSETWSAIADTVKQASEGNQVALEATGGMLAGIIVPGKKVPGGVVATDVNKAESAITSSAHSASSGLNLNKSLASEAQLAELAKNGGKPVAGSGAEKTLRDAPRLAAEYGGNASDWSKITSSSYKAADGTVFEIHAYRNTVTGQMVEPKSIPLLK